MFNKFHFMRYSQFAHIEIFALYLHEKLNGLE